MDDPRGVADNQACVSALPREVRHRVAVPVEDRREQPRFGVHATAATRRPYPHAMGCGYEDVRSMMHG